MPTRDDFLRKGYFPKELPPAYSTASYADALIGGAPTAFSTVRRVSRIVRHQLARPGLLHRTLGLPHPLHYYRLADVVAIGWPQVSAAFNAGRLSLTRPVDDPAGVRAVVPDPGADLLEQRIRHRASSTFIVRADVSQWYPSTYTHSIPWALHSKAVAKAKRARNALIGNRIDGHIQDSQHGQTVGMPIGPDTSFALGEAVLGRVDEFLRTTSPRGWVQGTRAYDDYELYVGSRHNVDRAGQVLSAALAEFDLILNPHKFKVLEAPTPVEDEWRAAIKRVELRNGTGAEAADLVSLFDEAVRWSRAYASEPVLAYALGQIISQHAELRHEIDGSNWPRLEQLLLQCAIAEPGFLARAAPLFGWARGEGFTIDRSLIGGALSQIALSNAVRGSASEVAWALWLALTLRVSLSKPALAAASRIEDDVVALIALHGRARGVFRNVDINKWKRLMTGDQLWDDHWLLAYEALIHGWLPSTSGVDFIAADPVWTELRAATVTFYDESAAIPPVTATTGLGFY